MNNRRVLVHWTTSMFKPASGAAAGKSVAHRLLLRMHAASGGGVPRVGLHIFTARGTLVWDSTGEVRYLNDGGD